MTVDSLRVAAYLDSDLYARLVEYAEGNGESISQAIASGICAIAEYKDVGQRLVNSVFCGLG